MTAASETPAAAIRGTVPDAGRQAIRMLRLVFFFSGSASLMYQVVWQRLLTVYYGVGPVATTLIVSTYMLGLGLGALAGGAAAERMQSRVRLYMLVELLLGLFGAASPWLLDALGRATAGASYPVAMLWMALFLSFPTVLMGTTLPLLTKAVNAVAGDFLKSLSVLYFINTLGAAVGALAASYVVISLFGLDAATYVAAAINLLLAAAVFPLRRLDQSTRVCHGFAEAVPEISGKQGFSEDAAQASIGTLGRWAYLCVFVTGFLAIGYEILWFRFLGVLLKDSPYAFSTILAVYLLGIALGSLLTARYRQSRLKVQGQSTFFLMQFLIGAYLWISFAGFSYLDTHVAWVHEVVHNAFQEPLQPPPMALPSQWTWNWAGGYLPLLVYPLVFVFVPTLLMGASFPLVTSLALRRADREGTTVGSVYFFNILGNVAGGIVTGYYLLAQFGTERTAMGFAIAGLAAVLLVSRFRAQSVPLVYRAAAFVVLAAAAVLTFPGRGEFYSMLQGEPWSGRVRHLAEGVDAVVLTDHGPNGTSNSINGLSHGHRPSAWYVREVFEAFSYAPKCRDVLVIGYGAGTFVENALLVDEVEHVTLVEISTSVIDNFMKIPEFEKMLTDPRVTLEIDDGRRFLLRTDHAYDMILIDPLRTTTSYSNNLYSREFFELVRVHLKPEGLLLAWMDDYWVFPHTLSGVFPKVRMYEFSSYMGFCLASNAAFAVNEQRASALFAKYSGEMQDEVPKIAVYRGDESSIRANTAGCPSARDWKPVMEFYFWREYQRAHWAREAGGQ